MGTYNKTVINSPKASVNQRVEAIYDYVGAVYGSNKDAKYDGNLTVAERQSVVGEFGELKPKSAKLTQKEVEAYLSKARISYISKLHLPSNQRGLCTTTPVNMTSFISPKVGKGYFFGGPHANCGIELGALYFSQGLELQVAAHPENWIFFPEAYGITSYGGRKVNPDQEQLLLKRIGEALGVPLYNPLPSNTTGLDVLNTASKKYKVAVEEYISIILLGLMVQQVKSRRIPIPQWPDLFTALSSALSGAYNSKPEDLRNNFFKYIDKKVPQSEAEEKVFWYKLGTTSFIRTLEPREKELMKHLIDVANELNVTAIQAGLRGNPTRKSALYQGGSEHADLVRAVYSSK